MKLANTISAWKYNWIRENILTAWTYNMQREINVFFVE